MSIGNLFKTALYSMRAHKLRVFLTMIGIIIGISSTVTIKSIGDGLTSYVTTSMESSSTNKYSISFEEENVYLEQGMIESFQQFDVADIKNVEGVKEVEVVTDMGTSEMVFGDIKFFENVSNTILTYPQGNPPKLKMGTWFKSDDKDKYKVVLTEEVAKKLFGDKMDCLGKGVTYGESIYQVIGVIETGAGMMSFMSSYCYIPKETLINNDSTSIIASLNVTLDPQGDKDKILEKIKEQLKHNHSELEGEYVVYDPSQDVQMITTMLGAITTFVTAITGIALFVGGVGVMNIMYVSVSERKREIGIRRAIGAKPNTILFQFLLEAILVTGVGGFIGIIFGYLFGLLVSAFIPIEGFTAVLTAKTLIGSASISILVGIIFGIIPARNAARLDPIKAIYQ